MLYKEIFKGKTMDIREFFSSDNKLLWIEQMKNCDWGAGQWLGQLLEQGIFHETVGNGAWVPMLTDGEKLVSFCTLAPRDEIWPTELTPWIGFVYTFPEYRGHRYAGIILDYSECIATVMGKEQVYISTDHVGLYEKYGYDFLNMQETPSGELARVYCKSLQTDPEEKNVRMEKGGKWKADIVSASKKDLDMTYNPAKTQEIRNFYENNVYGKWRNGEKVSYAIHKESLRKEENNPDNAFASIFRLSTTDDGIDVEITVENNGRRGSFTVRVYIPDSKLSSGYPNGFPFIVCMHPVQPKEYALEKGYGMIFMDTAMIAEDNNLRKGCFYDIYPYGKEGEEQTGELMAWGWGASKVLDAIYGGLDRELGLNAEMSAITGVSRWGKATAVCGAFEKRFQNVIPVCSGAGGLALWNYKSEGRTYDLTLCGGPKDYMYGQNEPLSCLQSEAEQGWFVDKFLEYNKYSDIPVEQYMLPVLAADRDRQYIIVAAWMGEDWVNAPAMWECYEKSSQLYADMGLSENIHAVFHKEGHALLKEDLEEIFKIIK